VRVEVLALHRGFSRVVGFIALAVALAAQVVRWWVVATLGRQWSTRIIVVPGASPVTAPLPVPASSHYLR